MTHPSLTLVVTLFLFTATERMVAAHLEVGPGRRFEKIEDGRAPEQHPTLGAYGASK